jgi:hypothetical protein
MKEGVVVGVDVGRGCCHYEVVDVCEEVRIHLGALGIGSIGVGCGCRPVRGVSSRESLSRGWKKRKRKEEGTGTAGKSGECEIEYR